MAGNEATVRGTLSIRKGTSPEQINYQSRPASFTADVAGTKGPSPGAFEATVAGTDVDFSELVQPGLCMIKNLDSTNFVTYGIWDSDNGKFFPLGELLPGEFYPLRISRDLSEESGTGTGTTGASVNTLRFKADTAACNVLVEAFEV